MGQDESSIVDESVAPRTLSARTLAAVAEHINSNGVGKIVVLTGAGISTAAGIPDFRSPKTGLYNNLARLNLPYAEAVFDIDYFRRHPEPFYVLARELYPGKFHPTVSHAFIALLARKGLLQMLFTQNIDCLERAAGVPADRIVEAHGSFATQRCIECKTEFPHDKMRQHVLDAEVPRCAEPTCSGIVKPDIVFFGESLPPAFGQKSHMAAMADLVLILGTSLTVYPFAGLPEMVTERTPRVLFNMERVGRVGTRPDDVVELGPCDDGIRALADALGWREELERFWREMVGEEEAERQLKGQEKQQEAMDDEMRKLTEGVEAALKLDDESEPQATYDADTDKVSDVADSEQPPPADRAQDAVDPSQGRAVSNSSPAEASAEPKGTPIAEPSPPEGVPSQKPSPAIAAGIAAGGSKESNDADGHK